MCWRRGAAPERCLLAAAVLCLLLAVLPAGAQTPVRELVRQAWQAQHSGHSERALVLYRRAAEQGDPVAQYQLGLMYEIGEGVPADAGEAEYWYGQAVDQGYGPGEIPDPEEYAAD